MRGVAQLRQLQVYPNLRLQPLLEENNPKVAVFLNRLMAETRNCPVLSREDADGSTTSLTVFSSSCRCHALLIAGSLRKGKLLHSSPGIPSSAATRKNNTEASDRPFLGKAGRDRADAEAMAGRQKKGNTANRPGQSEGQPRPGRCSERPEPDSTLIPRPFSPAKIVLSELQREYTLSGPPIRSSPIFQRTIVFVEVGPR